jgi:ectoine hydroxylase-related dioxygenase (phytanoyl-CoA dioxygenase family)
MPVQEYVARLAKLKPAFIHHPESKRHIREVLTEFGCDPEKTYFDVPRLRTACHGNYLSAGLAYAFHLHRDTWYSAPHCQLNWWMPVYDIRPDNCMAFHPRYWARAVRNDSSKYNYYEWNATSRKSAAQQVDSDTREQPHALDPLDPDPQIRVICNPGGILIFSGAQMHSTVPNTSKTTRISIDFRTVNFDDVRDRRGAPNADSACTGTTMRDYLRASDLERLPEDLVRLYDDASAVGAEVIYRPNARHDPRL